MKFYLDTDQSGHWYIVPLDKRDEWNEWLEIDPDDPESWDAPGFARMIGGAPQCVQFENPEVVF